MDNKIFSYICFLCYFFFSISALKAADNKQEVSGKEVTLSPSNYKQEIDVSGVVIVDYWAPWCGPCRKLAPILKDLSRDANIKIGKLNIDTYPTFVSQVHNINAIPTLIIYKDGKELHRLTGLFSKEELLLILKPYL